MKKILVSLLLLSIGTAGFCTKWTITNSGFTFSPATITISVGDSVNFNLAGIHNAVEVSQATWNANGNTPLPGFSVPFGGGLVLPAPLTPGTHYYVCSPHASSGMKGIIIVQDPLGIQEGSVSSDFQIYPNPSRGKFYLKINSAQHDKSYDLKIYDQTGNIVFAKHRSEKRTSAEIDLSGFPGGIYYISFLEGENIYEKKIIIL